jgi:propanediol dehydratase large subunit
MSTGGQAVDDTPDRTADLDQGRMRILDAKPVNLDGFSVANPDLGLVAMHSPFDPEPSLVVADGVVVELDGKSVDDFDVIDEFIALYGLDLQVAEEAMAMDDQALARLIVDFNVPRGEVVRLVGGITPAKLARVVALLSPVEMQMAMTRMRARRTPRSSMPISVRCREESTPSSSWEKPAWRRQRARFLPKRAAISTGRIVLSSSISVSPLAD